VSRRRSFGGGVMRRGEQRGIGDWLRVMLVCWYHPANLKKPHCVEVDWNLVSFFSSVVVISSSVE